MVDKVMVGLLGLKTLREHSKVKCIKCDSAGYILDTAIGVLLYRDSEYYYVACLQGYDRYNYWISIVECEDIESVDIDGLVFNNKNSAWIK